MEGVYRFLLKLYPAAFRAEFAEEMLATYSDAVGEISRDCVHRRVSFVIREIKGLLVGGLRQHLLGSAHNPLASFVQRSSMMRPFFRFSSVGLVFMAISFGLVLAAISKATAIVHGISPEMHFSLLRPLVVCFLIAAAAGLCGWVVTFATRRSGAHRMEQVETWQKGA
jgi:hypothetical protein